MIISFKNKLTERFYYGKRVAQYEAIAERAERKLRLLESADSLQALKLPSNKLEKLKGDRKGEYSIRINDQWRICFEWHKDGAHHVEIVDYH